MSVLDLKNVYKFLNSGAVLALQGQVVTLDQGQVLQNPWILAWEEDSAEDVIPAGPKFYLSEFTQEVGRWIHFKNYYIADRYEILSQLSAFKNEIQNPSFVQNSLDLDNQRPSKNDHFRNWKEPEFAEFEKYFVQFQEQVRTTDLKKIVPVVFSTSNGSFSFIERYQSLIHLLESHESLFAYGYWNPEGGILGASPELLFKKNQDELTTMALAGTGSASGPSLLEDAKERYEHQLVIEDIQKKLSDCHLVWESTQEWKVGVLKHLKTSAKGSTQINGLDMVKRLHPTAALGVMPSHYGLKKVSEFCDLNLRKYFGAPFGIQWMNSKNSLEFFIVALRNVQWNQHQTYLGSGCGLVKDSQLEKEWKELKLKREFTKRYLNL